MFLNCSNVQISGGVFINAHQQGSLLQASTPPPGFLRHRTFAQNFRSISLGDLDLLSELGKQEIVEYREIRRRKTGALVRRERAVISKRRMYQACVSGRPGILTAVVYQGTDIEKWAAEAKKHETFRHPSLVQLYGAAVSQAMNVLVYVDALMPLQDIRELHAGSALAATYVEYGIKRDLYSAFEYWQDMTGTWLLSSAAPNYTSWIRVSTGRLCIDVGDSSSDIKHLDVKSLVSDPVSRTTSIGYCDADLDSTLISRLQLDDIHVLLCSRLGYELTEVTFRSGQVGLGVIWPTSDLKQLITYDTLLGLCAPIIPADIVRQPWGYWENGLRKLCSSRDVINGWTRITLPPNMNTAHHLTTRVKIQTSARRQMQKYWLSQANNIARGHGAAKSYWLPGGVKFRVSLWFPEDNFTLRGTFMADTPPAQIYLFLFKPEVQFVDGFPVIQVPHHRDALYWSFDRHGKTRLTPEMAEEIGVPYVFFESSVTGTSWTEKDYETLAQFHTAKHHDPIGPGVAKALGYPVLGHKTATHTYFSEIDETEAETARCEMKTYPKKVFRRTAVRCPHCGGQPAVRNVVLPDIEVPPIHRHRMYRNVFIRADTVHKRESKPGNRY